jgi:hypothetical protein
MPTAAPSLADQTGPPGEVPQTPAPQAACRTSSRHGSTRYDTIYAKACHNCYERQYAASLEKALDQVAALEIDFYDDKDLLPGGEMTGNWYVRHGLGGGNDSNCTAPGDLRACLGDIKRWGKEHPGHDVVTVFLDKKQGWGDTRRPADLDALILSVFDRENVYAPVDLRGAHPTARAAANAGAWRTADRLHDKYVFVLTGGRLINPAGTQQEYVASRGAEAIAFVAPDADESGDILTIPNGFDQTTAAWLVFYNLGKDQAHLGPMIRGRGYVGRLWGAPEDDGSYREALGRCTNFIALYDLEKSLYGGRMSGQLHAEPGLHHHHKRGTNCEHNLWATSDFLGHHHHKRGANCGHGEWATDEVDTHHHHLRDHDCEHASWATDDQSHPGNQPPPPVDANHHHHERGGDCEHGHWATSEANGHHHHKLGRNCGHGEWATSSVGDHHHHKLGRDCEHSVWATSDTIRTPAVAPPPPHHHHKRGRNCEHGKWATNDVAGHYHHKRGDDCEHRKWATDDAGGHHHHTRDGDCEHGEWATD